MYIYLLFICLFFQHFHSFTLSFYVVSQLFMGGETCYSSQLLILLVLQLVSPVQLWTRLRLSPSITGDHVCTLTNTGHYPERRAVCLLNRLRVNGDQ